MKLDDASICLLCGWTGPLNKMEKVEGKEPLCCPKCHENNMASYSYLNAGYDISGVFKVAAERRKALGLALPDAVKDFERSFAQSQKAMA